MTLQSTLETIKPLGHTIIALSESPELGTDSTAWVNYLNQVSDYVEQRDAILVVPFSDLDVAEAFAAQTSVKTSYRIVCVCYPGTTQLAELAASMAAALANSADPALPFNGVNLAGIAPVDPSHKQTFERLELALHKGVCCIMTGADDVPEIVRAISTYQVNPTTGEDDDLLLDINGALTIAYVRKVMRQVAKQFPRSKNTIEARKNLRSAFLEAAIKLDDAEILENVLARKDELVVTQDATDKARANATIPAEWVRGMHVVAATIPIY